MLRALWFFVQLVAIVIAAVWILEQPGSFSVQFQDYTITATFGVGLLLFAALIVLALLAFRIVNGIVSIPSFIAQKQREKHRQKGYRAMTRGFSAVAAGNAKEATSFAKQVRRYLPREGGLALLLEAQAARLRGEEAEARRIFRELLKDKDAAFFGIRGLLKSAMDDGDTARALMYAEQAMQVHPKQPWILKTVYQLNLQNRKWDDALAIAGKAVKYDAISKDKARSDHIAILLHQAREDELHGLALEAAKKVRAAYKKDKCFIPSVLAVLKIYQSQDSKRKMKSVLTQAWKEQPHPDLLPYWEALAPENTPRKPMRKLRYYEKILALKPDSVQGQMAAARAATDAKLWGEAKAYLTAAERIEPQAEIYRLRAEIEQLTTNNEEVVRSLLLKASEAPAGKVWYCTLTGHIYERWSAIAEPHGAFNTIQWGYPQRTGNVVSLFDGQEALLIEPAA